MQLDSYHLNIKNPAQLQLVVKYISAAELSHLASATVKFLAVLQIAYLWYLWHAPHLKWPVNQWLAHT